MLKVVLLLSLLLPSCIVVPIRELANTQFFTTTSVLKLSNIAHLLSIIDMDINSNIIRGRSTSFSRNKLRESSILLNEWRS